MATRVEAPGLSVSIMNQKWNEAKSNAIESFTHLISKKGKPTTKLQAIEQSLQSMQQIFTLAKQKQEELQQSSGSLQTTKGYTCLSHFIKGVFVVGVAALATGAFSDLPVPYLKEVGIVLACASQAFSMYKEKKEGELKKKDDTTIESAHILMEQNDTCTGILKEQLFISIMNQVVQSFKGNSRELREVAAGPILDKSTETIVNLASLYIAEITKSSSTSLDMPEEAQQRTQPKERSGFSWFDLTYWRRKDPERDPLLPSEA